MKLQRSTKITLVVLLVISLTGAFLGLNAYRNRTSAALGAHVLQVEAASLSTQVTATGFTEGLNQVDVKALVAARIDSLEVAEGDEVKAKALLGRYDAAEITAQLAKAQSAAAQAEAQAALAQRKRSTDPSKYALDLATAERQLATARLSFDKAKESVADRGAEAERALQDAQAAFDLLKSQLELGRVTQADVDEARVFYEDAQMAFNQNKSGAVYGSAAYLGDYNALVQARANLKKLEDALANQDKTISDQLLQAQHRVDSARDQLKRLQEGGADRDIALAQAQLDDAAAALEQVRIQHELTRTTDEDVAAAESAAHAAQAAYQQALHDYGTPDILSPIDGKVLAVYVKEGDTVAPGTPLFTIGATHDLVVKAKIDEVDIGKIAVGQPARVTSSAYVGKTFEGTISKIAPRAIRDGNISVFIAEIIVKNPDDLLKPGMNVDVEIRSSQKDHVLALPLEAVLDRGGQKVVLVLDGTKVRQRQVTTGITTQTQVEITDGLKEGEKVVTGPAEVLARLNDGDSVKVLP